MRLSFWAWFFRWHHEHHEHHRFHPHVWLQINQTAILLNSLERTHAMSQIHIDQVCTLSLVAVDSKGNQVALNPDAPPNWTNSDESAATSAVSADGLTDTLTPVAVGKTTTVNVSVSIGGVIFTASIDEAVVAGAVAGIKIVETFAPAAAAPTP